MVANPNKALWEKGDFTRIAASMRQCGEQFIETLQLSPGTRVLDLGCGDGTTAIPNAQAGADVLGVDIARNLVEAGNHRAHNLGLSNCRFQEGCATDLDLPDNSFDVAISVFGAMFAPRPFDVAREMVRVTRPGGRVVMGNWIPGDPTMVAQLLKISAAYSPPPPEGFVSPVTWGIREHVVERFGQAGIPEANVSTENATWVFDYNGTPAEFVREFRDYYGPTMNAFEAAGKSGAAGELEQKLVKLFESKNESEVPGRTRIPATYLKVIVDVPDPMSTA